MLEKVVGGVRRIVNTNTSATLSNGRSVEVDEDSGVYNEDDRRTWYRVSWPVSGWIVGNSVGLPEEK